MENNNSLQLNYDNKGLIPVVTQDIDSGEVLMVAWMNAEAFRRTCRTGEAHFWSRSRKQIWHKGATSGNVLRVKQILADCDADTLLLLVTLEGVACHTGARSCFYHYLDEKCLKNSTS